MYGSHSKLQLADDCLFAYKKKYLEKVDEPISSPGRVGSAFHRFTLLYGQHCIDNHLETDITVVPELVKKAVFTGDWQGEELGSNIYQEVLGLSLQFGETHVFQPERIISLEERFPSGWDPDKNLWPEPNLSHNHTFVGIIDRLELGDEPDTVVIHDYKTSWAVESQSQVEKDPQLRRYAWLVHQEYPQFKRFLVRLDYVRHNIIREAGPLTIDEVEDTEKEIISALNQLQGIKEFPATPGERCAYCGYSEICPAIEDNMKVIINGEDEAVKTAREILLLEKRLNDRKKALQMFTATGGKIQVDQTEFGYFRSESSDISNIREFLDRLLNELGEYAWDYLKVDARKLKTLLKNEQNMTMLRDLLVDKSYTTFRHRRTEV